MKLFSRKNEGKNLMKGKGKRKAIVAILISALAITATLGVVVFATDVSGVPKVYQGTDERSFLEAAPNASIDLDFGILNNRNLMESDAMKIELSEYAKTRGFELDNTLKTWDKGRNNAALNSWWVVLKPKKNTTGDFDATSYTDLVSFTDDIIGTVTYQNAATLPDGSKANVKLTYSDVEISLQTNTSYSWNNDSTIYLFSGTRVEGRNNFLRTGTVPSKDYDRNGVKAKVKIQVVDDNGEPIKEVTIDGKRVPATLYLPMTDIDVDRNVYSSYTNLAGSGDPINRRFTEQWRIEEELSSLISDNGYYAYVPGPAQASPGSTGSPYTNIHDAFALNAEYDTDGTTNIGARFYKNENQSPKPYGTNDSYASYRTGFVATVDNTKGITMTGWLGSGNNGNGITSFAGSTGKAMVVWHKIKTSSSLGGKIQTTQYGNNNEDLSDSTVLEQGTYLVPELRDTVYTMTPDSGFELGELYLEDGITDAGKNSTAYKLSDSEIKTLKETGTLTLNGTYSNGNKWSVTDAVKSGRIGTGDDINTFYEYNYPKSAGSVILKYNKRTGVVTLRSPQNSYDHTIHVEWRQIPETVKATKYWNDFDNDYDTRKDIVMHIDVRSQAKVGGMTVTRTMQDVLPPQAISKTDSGNDLVKKWGMVAPYATANGTTIERVENLPVKDSLGNELLWQSRYTDDGLRYVATSTYTRTPVYIRVGTENDPNPIIDTYLPRTTGTKVVDGKTVPDDTTGTPVYYKKNGVTYTAYTSEANESAGIKAFEYKYNDTDWYRHSNGTYCKESAIPTTTETSSTGVQDNLVNKGTSTVRVMTTADDETHVVNVLPKYDEDGGEIEYIIRETLADGKDVVADDPSKGLEGYVTEVTEEARTNTDITNNGVKQTAETQNYSVDNALEKISEEESTDLSVTKKWQDKETLVNKDYTFHTEDELANSFKIYANSVDVTDTVWDFTNKKSKVHDEDTVLTDKENNIRYRKVTAYRRISDTTDGSDVTGKPLTERLPSFRSADGANLYYRDGKGGYIDEDGQKVDLPDDAKRVALGKTEYTEVTPAAGDNPSANGWYEYDASTEKYTATTDTTVDPGKTYYEKLANSEHAYSYEKNDTTYTAVTPIGNEDPSTAGWYEYDPSTDKYSASSDTTVDATKTYYSRTDTERTVIVKFKEYDKSWKSEDNGTILTTKPTTVTMKDGSTSQLYDGKKYVFIKNNNDGTWLYKVEELPSYINVAGNIVPAVYYLKEDDDFSKSDKKYLDPTFKDLDKGMHDGAVTNTEKIIIEGKKTWEDDEDTLSAGEKLNTRKDITLHLDAKLKVQNGSSSLNGTIEDILPPYVIKADDPATKRTVRWGDSSDYGKNSSAGDRTVDSDIIYTLTGGNNDNLPVDEHGHPITYTPEIGDDGLRYVGYVTYSKVDAFYPADANFDPTSNKPEGTLPEKYSTGQYNITYANNGNNYTGTYTDGYGQEQHVYYVKDTAYKHPQTNAYVDKLPEKTVADSKNNGVEYNIKGSYASDGVTWTGTVVDSGTTPHKFIVNKLPRYDASGNEIVYTIRETLADGSDAAYNDPESGLKGYTTSIDSWENFTESTDSNGVTVKEGDVYNSLYSVGLVGLKVDKVLSGRQFQNGDKFKFVLTAENNTPMPVETPIEIDDLTKADEVIKELDGSDTEVKDTVRGTVDFGVIAYTRSDLKSKEVKYGDAKDTPKPETNPEEYTIAERDSIRYWTAKVEVQKTNDKGDPLYKDNISGQETTSAQDTNNNNNQPVMVDKDKTFDMKNAADKTAFAALDTSRKEAATGTLISNSFTYKITENPQDSDSGDGKVITNDKSVKKITVNVLFDQINRKMFASSRDINANSTANPKPAPKYETGVDITVKNVTEKTQPKMTLDKVFFENEYEAKGTFTPEATKILNGKTLSKGAFSFNLKPVDTPELDNQFKPKTYTDGTENKTLIDVKANVTPTSNGGHGTTATTKNDVEEIGFMNSLFGSRKTGSNNITGPVNFGDITYTTKDLIKYVTWDDPTAQQSAKGMHKASAEERKLVAEWRWEVEDNQSGKNIKFVYGSIPDDATAEVTVDGITKTVKYAEATDAQRKAAMGDKISSKWTYDGETYIAPMTYPSAQPGGQETNNISLIETAPTGYMKTDESAYGSYYLKDRAFTYELWEDVPASAKTTKEITYTASDNTQKVVAKGTDYSALTDEDKAHVKTVFFNGYSYDVQKYTIRVRVTDNGDGTVSTKSYIVKTSGTTVTETEITDRDQLLFTNEYEPQDNVSVKVTKAWDDNDNAYKTRKDVTFHLDAVIIDDYTEVTPKSGDNPKTKGWYEKSGDSYALSSDTTASSTKKYYKAKNTTTISDYRPELNIAKDAAGNALTKAWGSGLYRKADKYGNYYGGGSTSAATLPSGTGYENLTVKETDNGIYYIYKNNDGSVKETWLFDTLFKKTTDGKNIIYKVREDAVSGYSTTIEESEWSNDDVPVKTFTATNKFLNGNYSIRVTKYLDGRALNDNDKFSFVLSGEDGAPMPVKAKSTSDNTSVPGDVEKDMTASGGNFDAGFSRGQTSFGPISYTQDDLKKEETTFKALTDDGRLAERDSVRYWTVTEEAQYDEQSGEITKDEVVTVYDMASTADVTAFKALSEADRNKATGTVYANTFTYYVVEKATSGTENSVDTDKSYIKNDTDKEKVVVNVLYDQVEGKILTSSKTFNLDKAATRFGDKDEKGEYTGIDVTVTSAADLYKSKGYSDSVFFTNKYTSEGEYIPEVTKTLNGRPLEDKQFKFNLKAVDTTEEVEALNGTLTESVAVPDVTASNTPTKGTDKNSNVQKAHDLDVSSTPAKGTNGMKGTATFNGITYTNDDLKKQVIYNAKPTVAQAEAGIRQATTSEKKEGRDWEWIANNKTYVFGAIPDDATLSQKVTVDGTEYAAATTYAEASDAVRKAAKGTTADTLWTKGGKYYIGPAYNDNGSISNENLIPANAIGTIYLKTRTFTYQIYEDKVPGSAVSIDKIKIGNADPANVTWTAAKAAVENGTLESNDLTGKKFELQGDEYNGYSYDGTIYFVQVVVTENRDGTLSTKAYLANKKTKKTTAQSTAKYALYERGAEITSSDQIVFANDYKAKGEALVKVDKTLDGRKFNGENEFTFTLTPKTTGAPLPTAYKNTANNYEVTVSGTTATVKIKPTEGDTYHFDFGNITFTRADLMGTGSDADNYIADRDKDGFYKRTFLYELKETAATGDGVSKDAKTITLAITVAEDKAGNIKVIGVNNVTAAAANAAALDTTEEGFFVDKAKMTGYNTATESPAHSIVKAGVFTNGYQATGDTTIKATKELKVTSGNSTQLEEGEFYFELLGKKLTEVSDSADADVVIGEGADAKYYKVTYEKVIDTKPNGTPTNNKALIMFDTLTYTLDQVKADAKAQIAEYDSTDKTWTYTYVVKEIVPSVGGRATGIKYDETEHTVLVVIKDNGDGTLDVKKYLDSVSDANLIADTDAGNEKVKFENKIDTMSIPVAKVWDGTPVEDVTLHLERALLDVETTPAGSTTPRVKTDAEIRDEAEALADSAWKVVGHRTTIERSEFSGNTTTVVLGPGNTANAIKYNGYVEGFNKDLPMYVMDGGVLKRAVYRLTENNTSNVYSTKYDNRIVVKADDSMPTVTNKPVAESEGKVAAVKQLMDKEWGTDSYTFTLKPLGKAQYVEETDSATNKKTNKIKIDANGKVVYENGSAATIPMPKTGTTGTGADRVATSTATATGAGASAVVGEGERLASFDDIDFKVSDLEFDNIDKHMQGDFYYKMQETIPDNAVLYDLENSKAKTPTVTYGSIKDSYTDEQFKGTWWKIPEGGTGFNGVIYDGTVHTVHLKVSENRSETLLVKTIYDQTVARDENTGTLFTPVYTNHYEAKGDIDGVFRKEIVGRDADSSGAIWRNDDSFKFKLIPFNGDDAPMPKDAQGNIKSEVTFTLGSTDPVTNKPSTRTGTFGKIEYNQSHLYDVYSSGADQGKRYGIYYYAFSETESTTSDNLKKDDTQYFVRVTVVDAGNGKLTTKARYYKSASDLVTDNGTDMDAGHQITFENIKSRELFVKKTWTGTPVVDSKIHLEKSTDGSTWTKVTATYEVSKDNGANWNDVTDNSDTFAMTEFAGVTATNNKKSVVHRYRGLPSYEVVGGESKKLLYRVVEDSPKNETGDTGFKVTPANGTVAETNAARADADARALEVTNEYKAKGTQKVNVVKQLLGLPWEDSEAFNYTLVGTRYATAFDSETAAPKDFVNEDNNNPIIPMPGNTAKGETAKTSDTGGTPASDTSTEIVENERLATFADITFTQDDLIMNPATGRLQGDFIYEIKEIIPGDAEFTHNGTKYYYKNYNTLDDAVKAASKGQWTYKGVKYDEKTSKVHIRVVDDLSGKLETEVAYNETTEGSTSTGQGFTPVYVNQYNAAGTVEIPVTKQISKGTWKDGDSFTFTLQPLAGAPMPLDTSGTQPTLKQELKATLAYADSDASDRSKSVTKRFEAIPLEKEGEFIYRIQEDNAGNIHTQSDGTKLRIAQSPVYVKVKVDDIKDGSYEATSIKYYTDSACRNEISGATSALFENKVLRDIKVTKQWLGDPVEDVYVILERTADDPASSTASWSEVARHEYDIQDLTNNKADYTFTNLAAFNDKGNAYTYRVTEKKETGVNQKLDDEYKWTNQADRQVAAHTDGQTKEATVKNLNITTTEITGTKAWIDGDARTHVDTGKDIESKLELHASHGTTTDEQVIKDADDKNIDFTWSGTGNTKYKVSNLRKFDDNGNLITYWVNETVNGSGEVGQITINAGETTEENVRYEAPKYSNADGSTVTKGAPDGGKITNTLKQENINFYGQKIWKHGDNDSTKYPTSADMTLYHKKTGDSNPSSTGKTITINGTADTATAGDRETTPEDDDPAPDKITKWNFQWENLPKYDDQRNEIEYSVEEAAIEHYKLEGKSGTGKSEGSRYTLTNTFGSNEVAYIKVVKNWDDNENVDGKRTAEMKVHIYKTVGGKTTYVGTETSKNVTADEGSSVMFGPLPVYENGAKIKYAIEEEASGIYSTKYVLGAIVSPTATLVDAADNIELDKTNTQADPYIVGLKNSLVRETTKVKVTKVWDDDNNADGKRPNKIWVDLYKTTKSSPTPAAGDALKSAVDTAVKADPDHKPPVIVGDWTLVERKEDLQANGWTHEFTGLNEKEFDYTASEDMVADANKTYYSRKSDGSFEKVANTDGKNPSQEKWYVRGQSTIVNYYVVEEQVGNGYRQISETGDQYNGFRITNTRDRDVINVEFTKIWDDNNDVDGIRPSLAAFEGSIKLYRSENANGSGAVDVTRQYAHKLAIESVGTHDYKFTWTDLPQNKDKSSYSTGSTKWYYFIREAVIPEGYDAYNTADLDKSAADPYAGKTKLTKDDNVALTYDNTAKVYKAGITDKHEAEVTSVTARKIWIDRVYLNGRWVTAPARPDTVKLTLQKRVATNSEGTAFGDWADTTDSTGSVITHDISKDNSTAINVPGGDFASTAHAETWVYTFRNLPKTEKVGDHNRVIQYRVVEKDADVPKGYVRTVPNEEKDPNVIVNTYQVVSIGGTKVWNGGDMGAKDNPSLTLTVKRQIEGGDVETVATNSRHIDWEGANYTVMGLPKYDKNGKRYTYWVEETAPEGYEASCNNNNDTPLWNKTTSDVSDTSDTENPPAKSNEQKADETRAYNGATITNTFNGKTTLSGKKTWVGGDADKHVNADSADLTVDKLGIELYRDGSKIESVNVAGVDKALVVKWSNAIGDATYTFGYIDENNDFKAYEFELYNSSTNQPYVYTVNEKSKSKEDAPKGYTGTIDGMNVTNTYSVEPAKITPIITKKVADMPADVNNNIKKFTFILAAKDSSQNKNQQMPAPAETNRQTVTLTAGAAEAQFDFGEFTFTEAGTYEYNLYEQAEDGWKNGDEGLITSSSPVGTITIEVTDNDEGKLVAKVQESNQWSKVIPKSGENPKNKGWYEEDVSGGHVLTEDAAITDGKDYYAPEYSVVKDVVTNIYDKDAKAVAPTIDVTKILTGASRPLNKDEFEFTLTGLSAEDAGAGYKNAGGKASAGTNSKDDDGDGKYETVQLGAVTFEKTDALGKYLFVLTEKSGSLPGITYDNTQYRVEAEVTDKNADGDIEVSWKVISKKGPKDADWVAVDATDQDKAEFSNAYVKSEVDATPVVKKSLTVPAGSEHKLNANDFEFRLIGLDGAQAEKNYTGKNAAGATTEAGAATKEYADVNWTGNNALKFTIDDLKNKDGSFDTERKFKYTVFEKAGNDDKVLYDGSVYTGTLRIYIDDADGGKLKSEWISWEKDGTQVTAKGTDASPLTFDNEYVPNATSSSLTGDGNKTVKKVLVDPNDSSNKRTLKAEEFTFQLTGRAADTAAGTKDASGLKAYGLNGADGTVTFPAFPFTETGKYVFDLKEVKGQDPSIATWDRTEYVATAIVTEEKTTGANPATTGNLKVVWELKKKNGNTTTGNDLTTAEFTNKLKLETIDLAVNKIWKGDTRLGSDAAHPDYNVVSRIRPDNVTIRLYIDKNGNKKYDSFDTATMQDADAEEVYLKDGALVVKGTEGSSIVSDLKLAEGRDDNDKWTAKFENLPKYDASGKAINYMVVELKAGTGDETGSGELKNYKTEYNQAGSIVNKNTAVVTNTIVTTGITGSKVWKNDDGVQHNNAKEVDLHVWYQPLKADGTNDGNPAEFLRPAIDWSGNNFTIVNLPKYDKYGHEYTYWVTEDQVNGYDEPSYNAGTSGGSTIDIDGDGKADGIKDKGNIVNTAKDTFDVPFRKEWKTDTDLADQESKVRPESISVRIYIDKDGGTANQYDEGEEVYLKDGVLVTKNTVGAKEVETKKVDKNNKWSGEFKDMPKFDSDGKTITYKVEEVAYTYKDKNGNEQTAAGVPENLPGKYKAEYELKNGVWYITNTYEMSDETVEIKATKKWVGDSGNTGERNNVRFVVHQTIDEAKRLVKDSSVKSSDPVNKKNEQNVATRPAGSHDEDLEATWTLPKYYGTELIDYSVEELDATTGKKVSDNYVITYEYKYGMKDAADPDDESKVKWIAEKPSGWNDPSLWNNKIHVTVTNTFKNAELKLPVRKIWNDERNQDGLRGDVVVAIKQDTNPPKDGSGKDYYTGTWNGKDINGKDLVDKNGNPTDAGKIKLDDNNNFKDVFEKLPVFDKDGKRIAYTVEELTVGGEKVADRGYTVNITRVEDLDQSKGLRVLNVHKPEAISVKVTKKWSGDDEIKDDTRKSVKLYLIGRYVDDKGKAIVAFDGGSKTIDRNTNAGSNEDAGDVTWTDLPKKFNGRKLTYEVYEDVVPGYVMSGGNSPKEITSGGKVTGYEFTIKNDYVGSINKVEATKEWDDGNNADKLRSEVYFQLYRKVGVDGEEKRVGNPVKVATGDSYNNNLTATWNNLPETLEGKGQDTYVEVEPTYAAQENPNAEGWYERDDTTGIFSLTGDTKVKDDKTYYEKLTDDNYNKVDPTYAYTDNPKNEGWYEKSGNDYSLTSDTTVDAGKTYYKKVTNNTTERAVVYWVKEVISVDNAGDGDYSTGSGSEAKHWKVDAPKGYTSTVVQTAPGVFKVENIHEPAKTDIIVKKTWVDSDNKDGIRPDHITVTLKLSGNEVAKATITKDDGWTHTFKNVPESDDYEIVEKAVDGYVTNVEKDSTSEVGKKRYTITNTHSAGKEYDVTATKVWKNDTAATRKDVELTLMKKVGTGDDEALKKVAGAEVKTIKANATGNELTVTWKNMPSTENGKTVVYTVKENEIDGYKSTVSDTTVDNEKLTMAITVTNEYQKKDEPTPTPSGGDKLTLIYVDPAAKDAKMILKSIQYGTAAEIQAAAKKLAGKPGDPKHSKLKFIEWVANTDKFGNVVMVAKYSQVPTVKAKVVSYLDGQSKNSLLVSKVTDDESSVKKPNDPSHNNLKFVGWKRVTDENGNIFYMAQYKADCANNGGGSTDPKDKQKVKKRALESTPGAGATPGQPKGFIPPTGDEVSIWAWILLMIAAGTILIVFAAGKRKEKQNEHL